MAKKSKDPSEKKSKKEKKEKAPSTKKGKGGEPAAPKPLRNPLKARRERMYQAAETESPGFLQRRSTLKRLLCGCVLLRIVFATATLLMNGFSLYAIFTTAVSLLTLLFFCVAIYNGLWPLSLLVLAQAGIGLARLLHSVRFPGPGFSGVVSIAPDLWYWLYIILSFACLIFQAAAMAYVLTIGRRACAKIGEIHREINRLIEGPPLPHRDAAQKHTAEQARLEKEKRKSERRAKRQKEKDAAKDGPPEDGAGPSGENPPE